MSDLYYRIRTLNKKVFGEDFYIQLKNSNISYKNFLIYLHTSIIPKMQDIRLPSQISLQQTLLTIYSFDDIFFLIEQDSLNALKKRRIIRLFEESVSQNNTLTYNQVAYITSTTENSVYNLLTDLKMMGINLKNNNNNMITRKSFIIKYILLKYINTFSNSYTYSSIMKDRNYKDCYITFNELIFIASEFIITIADLLNLNTNTKEILIELCTSIRQQKEYIDIYKKCSTLINSKYSFIFNKIVNLDRDALFANILTYNYLIINNCHEIMDDNNQFTQVADSIRYYIELSNKYYINKSYSYIQDNSILYYFKDINESKFSSNNLKEVHVQIWNEYLYGIFEKNTNTNREIIKLKVEDILEQAEKHNCNAAQIDLCFLTSLTLRSLKNHNMYP